MKKRNKQVIALALVGVVVLIGIFFVLSPGMIDGGNGGGEIVRYDEPPSKPILEQPTSPETDGNINLDWSDSERVVSYTVWKKYGSLGITETVAYALTVSHYTDYETRNGEWYYRIVAINVLTDDSIGKTPSDWKIVKVDIPLVIPPENQKPTATIISITPRSATQGTNTIITFSGTGTDSDGSIVKYKWLSVVDGTVSILSIGNTFSISADELSIGRHKIKFRVKDNDGEWSFDAIAILNIYEEVVEEEEEEEEEEVPDLTAPEPPHLYRLTYDVDGEEITVHLDWDVVDDADTYNVYKDINGTGYSLLKSFLTVDKYDDIVSGDGVYSYYVTAVNENGESDPSSETSLTVELGLPVEDLIGMIIILVVIIVGAVGIIYLTRRLRRKLVR